MNSNSYQNSCQNSSWYTKNDNEGTLPIDNQTIQRQSEPSENGTDSQHEQDRFTGSNQVVFK